MTDSKIQWTNKTWNPVVGCTRVSPGCANCYASTFHNRRGYKGNVRAALAVEGEGAWTPAEARAAGYDLPMGPQFDQPFRVVQLMPERLAKPLSWRGNQLVFVNSGADLFHKDVPFDFLVDVFAIIQRAGRHTFQILTKRPERMRDFMNDPHIPDRVSDAVINGEAQATGTRPHRFEPLEWPPPNAWLGVSAENQATANERVPLLLDTPAAVRFVSAEPLLEYVDFDWLDGLSTLGPDWAGGKGGGTGAPHPLLDWIILGGESGPGARPCAVEWIEQMIRDCADAEVPVFVKQLGSKPTDDGEPRKLRQPKGGDPSEWLEHLRRREYPRGFDHAL